MGACNAEQKLLSEAEEQRAAGKFEEALATLELVAIQAPGSEQASTARQLGATWLIAAADGSSDLHEKKARLERALKFRPDDGEASLKLCEILLAKKDAKALRECLDERLKNKQDVPNDRLVIAKNALRDMEAARDLKWRKELLASRALHHWEALIDKFPDSAEAKKAVLLVERSRSLCKDLDGFLPRLRTELARLLSVIAGIDAGDSTTELSHRLDAYSQQRKLSKRLSHEMKDLAGDVKHHRLTKGEESLQNQLHCAFWKVSDAAAALIEVVERHPIENVTSFDRGALQGLSRWSRAWKAKMGDVEKAIATVESSCEALGSSAGK